MKLQKFKALNYLAFIAFFAFPVVAQVSERSTPVRRTISQPPGGTPEAIQPIELSIKGVDTLGTPASGYRWERDASAFPLRFQNTSGWNQSLTSNDGRTGISAVQVMVEQNGNGDISAFYGHCEIAGTGRAGAKHWLAEPACVILNGDLATTLDHSYLNEQEFNLSDNGHDVAAIASVQNFHRTNDAAAFGEVWMGDRWQSLGSRAIDVGWSLSGLANIGLDTVTAHADSDWNGGRIVALNMAADQRVVFNAAATPINGIAYYGNVAGSAYDTFASAAGQLARCNAGGCWMVGADTFVGSATRAGKAVSVVAENTGMSSGTTARIEARAGKDSRVALVAQPDGARISATSGTLVVEVGDKEIARFGRDGFSNAGAVAFRRPVSIASARYQVGAAEYSLIFTSAVPVTLALPDPAGAPGRILQLKTTGAGVVRSTSSNVVALSGGAPADLVLPAGGGRWAMLQSDGANWIVMGAN